VQKNEGDRLPSMSYALPLVFMRFFLTMLTVSCMELPLCCVLLVVSTSTIDCMELERCVVIRPITC